MSNLISLMHKALLALALSCASAAALAGPSYHVTVNTAGLSGAGFLDFSVVGAPGAPGAIASVSNLTGDFGLEAERVGAVAGSIPAGFTLTNAAGDNYLTQAVNFGALFGFDISFAGDYESLEGIDGATFTIGLFDDLFSQYTLAASFAVQPAIAGVPVSLTAETHLSGVTIEQPSAVPEPAAPVLVLTGLMVAGALLRRRSIARKPRALHDSSHAMV